MDHAPPRLTVYYDGGCPLCEREIGYYRRRRGAGRVRWVDIAQCDDRALGPDLDRAAAFARLHARRPDGVLLSGARAFAALWQALPGLQPLGRIAALPGIVHGLEWAYRGFLRVRPLWRRPAAACRLPD